MDLEKDTSDRPDPDDFPPDGGEPNVAPPPVPEPEPEELPLAARSSRADDWLAEKRALETQARIYQEEADRARREVESIRASQRPDPREEQARLEAMDPEQRVLYHFDKQAEQLRNAALISEGRTAAQIDQLKFEANLDKTASSLGWPSAQRSRYAQEIESMYNNIANRALQAGRPDMVISRIDLLKHKLGDELMTTGSKAVKTATAKGKENIARQTTRMVPASSNVSGKSTGKTRAEEALERMQQAGVIEM